VVFPLAVLPFLPPDWNLIHPIVILDWLLGVLLRMLCLYLEVSPLPLLGEEDSLDAHVLLVLFRLFYHYACFKLILLFKPGDSALQVLVHFDELQPAQCFLFLLLVDLSLQLFYLDILL
jgi:hypothetical protein